jgi:hypothetical protein
MNSADAILKSLYQTAAILAAHTEELAATPNGIDCWPDVQSAMTQFAEDLQRHDLAESGQLVTGLNRLADLIVDHAQSEAPTLLMPLATVLRYVESRIESSISELANLEIASIEKDENQLLTEVLEPEIA